MIVLYSLGAAGLLSVTSFGLLAVRPNLLAIPWLGLAVVILATALTFNVSAHLVADGHDGVGIGPVMTSMLGLLGVGIVFVSVRLRAVAFVPLGAIVAGGIYISSFYGYLPPFNHDFPGPFVFAAPGFLLASYGGYLWYRNGLAESMEHRSRIRRLCIALVIVAGLGVLGFFQFERPGPSGSKDPLLSETPNLLRMAEEAELVAEGVVMSKDSFRYKSRKAGRNIRYTLYEMDVTHFWRGNGPQIIRLAVRDYSPVKMTVGQPYLYFASGMPNQEELPGYWSADFPTHV